MWQPYELLYTCYLLVTTSTEVPFNFVAVVAEVPPVRLFPLYLFYELIVHIDLYPRRPTLA